MQTNFAAVNTKAEVEKRNASSVSNHLKSYLRHPGSGILALLTGTAALITFAVLIFLVVYILAKGIPYLTPDLFSLEYNSENVSLMPSLINTFIMTFMSLLIAAPLGIFAAIYLVEYAKKGNKLVKIIRVTAETLSGIPSIVFGLFGMLFFVTALHWGMSLLAGSCTLVIMVLPLIMRTSEEALKAVPDSYREASFGLGAGKLRTIFTIVLPSAVPGILAGVILAIGRIIGETAALLYTSGTVAQVPNLMGSGRTLALHMYVLSSEGLHMNQASATAVVILIFVLIINGLSSKAAKRIAKG
ncbi:MAG TPA: phosphate ABC transporter permease PstA [Candidatus Blautia faecipullorum]|nr:phosphate ABC transporter permease PstA [Candidatus Blautia faecipullorum]